MFFLADASSVIEENTSTAFNNVYRSCGNTTRPRFNDPRNDSIMVLNTRNFGISAIVTTSLSRLVTIMQTFVSLIFYCRAFGSFFHNRLFDGFFQIFQCTLRYRLCQLLVGILGWDPVEFMRCLYCSPIVSLSLLGVTFSIQLVTNHPFLCHLCYAIALCVVLKQSSYNTSLFHVDTFSTYLWCYRPLLVIETFICS